MHRHTPAITVYDARGATARTVVYCRRSAEDDPQPRITQTVDDFKHRASHVRDPRLFALLQDDPATPSNHTTIASLSGGALLSVNVDAGWHLSLPAASGQPLQNWDQKLNQRRTVYDALLRPAFVFEAANDQGEWRAECFSYADANTESARHNRCGQLIRHDDTAGTQFFNEFSILGAPLEQAWRFLNTPQVPDWPLDPLERDALLEAESAVSQTGYNALGEQTRHLDAAGHEQYVRQTLAGELAGISLKMAGARQQTTLVGEIHYNAEGQIEQQTAGNQVVTRCSFDPESGRLSRLLAHLADKPALQDLAYTYDPVGNLISINDGAQPIRYSRNQRVIAVNTYRYDTLYQLIEATGQQRINLPWGPQLPEFSSPPDPGQLENYQQTFDYDDGGNLFTLQHHADSGQRTERTAVATLSNRSLPYTALGERPGESEICAAYDANGNLNALQKGKALRWGCRDRLHCVDQVVRVDQPNDNECYFYDGGGRRRRKVRTVYSAQMTRLYETRYFPGLEIRTSPEETLQVISVQAGRCNVQVLHWEKVRPSGIADDQHRFILTDHLGSSSLELDIQGLLISQESYYAYGGTAWWAGRDKVEASYRTVRYSGQERDATGLYYYGFRYYLPWRQRWLSADPGGVHDGLNLYRMVGGNPIGFVDLQGLAKTRVTPTQRLKAIPSGMGRGIVKGAAGFAAKHVAKTVMKLAAQEALRSAAMVLSGASWAYASAGLAGHYLEAAGVSRISKGLGMGAAALGGLLAGVGVVFLSDPVDVLAEVAKNLGSGATGRLISSVGGSIAYDGNATPRSQAVNVGADLAVNFGEGMLFSVLPSAVPPILKSMSNGAMKSGLGDSIRSAASVPASYRESNPTFPTLEDMKTFGKGFLHDTAMSSVYGVGDVLINRGIGTALGNQVVDPVLRAGFENLQLAGQFDALVGERVLSGVGLHEVNAVPNVTTPRADTDRNLFSAADKRRRYKETRNSGNNQRLLNSATTSV
ncbi:MULTISPECIES: RHS repeat-associated core domain-containing protein [unclassified Pseudomonas]|uniref:RHS repeat-associated core domain-containing protein n=1 Tax=unclassified Pseudomonas TaxID=196821 RepID=UPI001F55F020|nr:MULTISPECIES: RHS repeat-associated core domain-containing protein [unclassified Pseudomonas]